VYWTLEIVLGVAFLVAAVLRRRRMRTVPMRG
jgi:hypothetical protein